MKGTFSARDRQEILKEMTGRTLDLLVIGGGITGAGIAWDASKRGMRTGLLEMNDFAFGTSSRSTKLVHGGLRYLKKGEIRLVQEVGKERALLHRQAPHIVIPIRMLLPIYKKGTFGYHSSSLGLYIYDRLAGVQKPERRRMMKRDQALRQEPLLRKEGLLGAGVYYEYRTDDARLTLEVLKTAVRNGAQAVNYAEVTEFIYYNGRAAGVKVVDRLTGEEYEIRAKKLVNATGPWVDSVRSRDHAIKGKRLLLTKGVHLVVDHKKLPVRQAAYFDVPDGRMIFVIPRDGKTYIGTTDTVYEGSPENPRTTAADRDYLLNAVRGAFPNARLDADDVESMWAGLRPLIREEGKNPSDISRKDEVWVSRSGLITIAGGKLTGFRKMAEKVVDLVAGELVKEGRQTFAPCMTDKETLSGGDSGRSESYEELRDGLIRMGLIKGLPMQLANHLANTYGSNAAEIYNRMEGISFDRFREELHEGAAEGTELAAPVLEEMEVRSEGESMKVEADSEPQEPGEEQGELTPSQVPEAEESLLPEVVRKALYAEISYVIDEEMAVTAGDFLVRRTGMLYFNRPWAETIAIDVLEAMAERLGWDEGELEKQRLILAKEWEYVTEAPARD